MNVMWLLLIIILIVVAMATGWLNCSFGKGAVVGRHEESEPDSPVTELTDDQAREIDM